MVVLLIVIVIIVLLALFLIGAYNGMVRARNKVDEAWSGIDVQLKRRHDLIPNLVESVKGYAAHERETFQAVTDARARAMSASGPAQASSISNWGQDRHAFNTQAASCTRIWPGLID